MQGIYPPFKLNVFDTTGPIFFDFLIIVSETSDVEISFESVVFVTTTECLPVCVTTQQKIIVSIGYQQPILAEQANQRAHVKNCGLASSFPRINKVKI